MSEYVLVVDDYPDVRNLVVTLLDSMGVESRQAVNGASALEVVDAQMPRAIVLDLMMPVMNGFTMLTQLYNRKPGKTIPVILLSGVADDQQMKALPGVIGVLKKGAFSVEDLRALLLEALGDLSEVTAQPAEVATEPIKGDTRPLSDRRPVGGVSTRLV